MNKLLLFLLWPVVAFGATTLRYVDPDYTGGSNDGTSAHPWTSAAAISWSSINSTLASGPVTIYFSALKANGVTQQSQSADIHVQRTDGSINLLVVDGYSFYNNNTTTPSWQANPNSINTAYTNSQVFNIGGHQLGWGRADAQSASVVTVGGTNFQCIHSHISGASTQPPVGAQSSNFWSYLFWPSGPANGVYSTASPSAWSSGVAYVAPSRQDNVQLTGFEANGGFGGYLGDNLIVDHVYFHDYAGGQPGQTILYTSDSSARYPIAAPCTNILLHDFRINNTSGEGTYVGAVNPDASAPFQVAQSNQMNGLTITNFWIDNTGALGGQGDGIDEKNGILNVTIMNGDINHGFNRMGGIIVGQTQTPSVSQNQIIDSVKIQNTSPSGPGGSSEGEAIYMNSSTITGGVKGYNGVTIRNCALNNNYVGIYNVNGGGPIDNITVENCSVRNTTNSPGITISPSTTGAFSNNVCWKNNGNGTQASVSAKTKSGFNAYSTAGGPGAVTTAVVDSDFTSPTTGDLSLANASVREVNAGVTISAFAYDIIGTSRPQGSAWDIGAFEFIIGGGTAPTISTQPQGQNIAVSQTISLTVAANGTTPLNFQWLQGSVVVQNGSSSTYSRPNAQTTDSGTYTCIITNLFGTVTSSGAVVNVTNAAVPVIGVNPGSLNFGLVVTNSVTPLSFTVANVGSGTLNGTVTASAPYSILSGGTLALAANATQIVTVNYTPTLPEQDNGNVTVSITAGASTNVAVTGIAYTLQNYANIQMSGSTPLQNFNPLVTGGTCIMQNIQTLTPGLGGIAYAGFTLPNGVTNISMTAQVEATNGAANSLYIAIDQFPIDPNMIWDVTNIIATPGLATQPVSWRGNGTFALPQFPTNNWNLAVGNHYVVICGREAFTRLQSLSVVNQSQAYVVPPIITVQPASQTVLAGSQVEFDVGASGTAPLSYQWNFNGSAIPGANLTSYVIASTLPTNTGQYSCLVTNIGGSATSFAATLNVTNAVPNNVKLHIHGKKP